MNYFLMNGDHNVSHGAFYLMCTKPRPQVMWTNKFCSMVPNIYWYLVWGLLHANLLAPEILMWLLHFFFNFLALPLDIYLPNYVTQCTATVLET
jgi:hypothetical protein